MSKKRNNDPNPFVTYSLAQVEISESTLYMVQLGRNVYESEEGQFFWPQSGINRKYNKIVNDLLDKIYHGTIKEQRQAKAMLPYLRVVPLRLH
jgi:hypothetical protein